jgi:hypothetical protein
MRQLVFLKFLQEVGMLLLIASYSQTWFLCPIDDYRYKDLRSFDLEILILFPILLLYALSKLKIKQSIVSQIICIVFWLGVIFTSFLYYALYVDKAVIGIHMTVDLTCPLQIGFYMSLFGFIAFVLGSFFKKKTNLT